MDKTVEEILMDEIKHLRALLKRKEQALAILEGNDISGSDKTELQTNSPISLNALYEYPKTAPIKKKIQWVLKTRSSFMRKSDIVTNYLTKEGIRDTEENRDEATDEVTNALSNLRTQGKVAGYKPERIRMKGGLWGLIEFFDGEQPNPKYIPDLAQFDEDE